MFLIADDTGLVFIGSTWHEAFANTSLDLIRFNNLFDHNTSTVNIDEIKFCPIFLSPNNDPSPTMLKMHSCMTRKSDTLAVVLVDEWNNIISEGYY